MKSARRLVLSAAALPFGMMAAAFLVLLVWPVPVSMRPIAETVPESVLILARPAVERSYGPHSGVSFAASRLLMSGPDERTMNRWRIDGLILAARIRHLLGRERAAAQVATNSYYGAG
jgi:hypothetical protein